MSPKWGPFEPDFEVFPYVEKWPKVILPQAICISYFSRSGKRPKWPWEALFHPKMTKSDHVTRNVYFSHPCLEGWKWKTRKNTIWASFGPILADFGRFWTIFDPQTLQNMIGPWGLFSTNQTFSLFSTIFLIWKHRYFRGRKLSEASWKVSTRKNQT